MTSDRTNALAKLESQMDYLLLDGSGSMSGSMWHDSLRAIDTYVATLKAERVNTQIYLHPFGDGENLDICAYDGGIADWSGCHHVHFPNAGTTPLYDAIMLMGQRFKAWDPPKAAATILTDGDQNGSRFCDLAQAKAILDWMRAKGWKVTFIGCEFDNSEVAKLLGAGEGSSIGVNQAKLSDATTALAKKRARHALYGEDIEFTGDEKTKFGGYLAGPSK